MPPADGHHNLNTQLKNNEHYSELKAVFHFPKPKDPRGTGNPYKELVADLIKQGVQVEECAVSMKSHNWINEDLLPGLKVNTGTVGRLIQLA